jgi:pimeloyl-ACP methyl ester carboxylesterase
MSHTHSIDLSTGETLAYRERPGGSVPLLLIHGNASSSTEWRFLFETLPERYHCYAVDLRGFGDSTYGTQIDSLADLASDVEDALQALDLDSVHAMGWSTGGGVAMELALATDRVRSLVLLSSVGTRGFVLPELDMTGEPTGELLTERETIVSSPQVVSMEAAQRNDDAETIGGLLDATVFNGSGTPSSAYREAFIESALAQRNYAEVVYALTQFNLSAEHNGVTEGRGVAASIDVPTLVCWGDRDAFITENRARQTASDIGENAEFVLFEGAGHTIGVDARDELVSRVIDFHDRIISMGR